MQFLRVSCSLGRFLGLISNCVGLIAFLEDSTHTDNFKIIERLSSILEDGSYEYPGDTFQMISVALFKARHYNLL